MASIPTFTTERLVLRELIGSDTAAYKKHFVDYEVIRNLSDRVPWPYPDDGVETFLRDMVFPRQNKDRWMWAICLREDPENLIGAVELWRDGKPENRAFWLGREYWGKGYMTEAVEPVMDYAFNELGFETLVFSNAVGNSRSGRVKEKTGARFLRREAAAFVDPAFVERELYMLSKNEWQAFKAARERDC